MVKNKSDLAVVGVGASAGGLEALRAMFGGYDGQTGMAFVVVQHLDPTHESLMAQLLERYTSMKVTQAAGGERLEPDHIYVIPPGHGLALDNGVLRLTEFTDPRGMRRPIDDFFESLAKDLKERAACVILSGTGGDGSRGLRFIKENNGICVVQDPSTAAYDGMPASAIGTDLVDITCKPAKIVGALQSFFENGSIFQERLGEAGDVADSIDQMCDVLQQAVGHDFTRYKHTTLSRRIARRMQVLGITGAEDYLARLQDDGTECEALFRDLLINVTRFFRDKEHFDALDRLVINPLVEGARDGEELRVWVPGCSSGEEAYSIAMLFAAAKQRHNRRPYVQIFATDIDERMIDIARGATYPLSALDDLPADFREGYIIGGPDKFVISPMIRDMVRFTLHNVISDPPYSKIDLVSCRNLLIYFEEDLQKMVVPLFHFALSEKGRLFLGSSEAIGRYVDLFEPVEQSARIFKRKNVRGNYTLQLPGSTKAQIQRRASRPGPSEQGYDDRIEFRALESIAQRYAPVSMLVDKEGTLLERWGSIGRYLDFPDRVERSIHVLSLARKGLREIMGPLLRDAIQKDRRVGARDVDIVTEYGTVQTRVICEPVEDAYLFIIEETGKLRVEDDLEEIDVEESQAQFLEEELQATRLRLRTTVEELETANEELKSSNEEMMSMNEELQSTNEELTTVNDELKNKVDQITIANSDLKNFFDSTQLAVLVVDLDLKLRSFTEAAGELFPIDASFIGWSLAELPHKFENREYLHLARAAAIDGKQSEINLHSPALGAEFILRVMPYRLLDGSVDGATLVFTDVSKAVSLERSLRAESERLRLALEVAKIGIWEYEPSSDLTVLDETERRLLNIPDDGTDDTMESILASLYEDDRARINRSLRMAMEGERDFDEIFRIPLGPKEDRWLHGLGKVIDLIGGRRFIGVTFDITAERTLLDQRELMIREMNHRVKNLFSVIAAMISLEANETDDVSVFSKGLRNRILALGRSHSLTNSAATGKGGAPLRELIKTAIAPNRSAQAIELEGEDVTIRDAQITSLALIFHEWATNSVKYGALALKDGKVHVQWKKDGDTVLIDWEETGGIETDKDEVPGFGATLINAAAMQLSGECQAEATTTGFRQTLQFPLAK